MGAWEDGSQKQASSRAVSGRYEQIFNRAVRSGYPAGELVTDMTEADIQQVIL